MDVNTKFNNGHINQYNIIEKLMSESRLFNDTIVQYTHKFRKNSFVYRQGDVAKNIYFVITGQIQIGTYLNDKESIISIIKSGEIFGENALTNIEYFPDFAMTTEESQISIVPIHVWEEMAGKFPELTMFLIKIVLNRKNEVQARLESVVYKDTKTRILDFIFSCLDDRGQKVNDQYIISDMLTHQAIANWVSTSRQTVTIFMNELKEKSIIDFDRKKFTILDIEELKAQYN